MYEQSKAAKRRVNTPDFPVQAFSGNGVDIGAGPDPISKVVFPLITSVRDWDMKDGDAQYMATITDNTVDFVNSSHCLEHMVDPVIALTNWIRIVKPGGYLIITIPDEDLYEHGCWPSRFNSDHKWSFTTKRGSPLPKSVNVYDFVDRFLDVVEIKTVKLIEDGFDYTKPWGLDQTLSIAECAIEIILKKK